MPSSSTPVCDALGFDAAALGEMCARMPLVAMQLRHASPQGSLGYIHPESREGQFLNDLLEGKSTQELAERWDLDVSTVSRIFG